MRRLTVLMIVSVMFAETVPAEAVMVRGGGRSATDCAAVFEIPGANTPAPPAVPKTVKCFDGDPTCDDDGLRNGECVFPLQLCINSTAVGDCTPDSVDTVVVSHAIDDGEDRRFDVDFQALQSRADGLGLPSSSEDDCTLDSAITVRLRGPNKANRMRTSRKVLRVTTEGTTGQGSTRDKDRVRFVCRPEGDRIYLPTELYDGTFDRIRTQVFQQSCSVSACHDSEGNAGNLILLSGAAYGNIVNVGPNNLAAAGDGLLRVDPGDPTLSFLYRKMTGDLAMGYGAMMPLEGKDVDENLIEIIRLWIIGDGILGEAPENGWVTGTDQ